MRAVFIVAAFAILACRCSNLGVSVPHSMLHNQDDFSERNYSVVYYGNGNTLGSVPVDDKRYTHGMQTKVLPPPSALKLGGADFVGWNTRSDGGGETVLPGAAIQIGGNVRLYAVYALLTARNWRSVSLSDDGSVMAAAADGAQIFVSTDFGAAWRAHDSGRTWRGVTVSGDGTKMAAVVWGGNVYIAQDATLAWGPTTWTAKVVDGQQWQWSAIAGSDNGMRLAASVFGGKVYISKDAGQTWTPGDSNGRNWQAVAIGRTSNVAAGVVNGGQIFVSHEIPAQWGTNWTQRTVDALGWAGIALSADGTKVAAVANFGSIYVSGDAGATWTSRGPSGLSWNAATVSGDGSVLAAAVFDGPIYNSTDGGVTWAARDQNRKWSSIASSAGGEILLACEGGSGHIYASADAGATWTPRF